MEGSRIYLEGSQSHGLDTQQLKPFSVCLDDGRTSSEAVLVYMACMEAMIYLYSFAKELLAGKPTILKSIFSTELDTDLLI